MGEGGKVRMKEEILRDLQTPCQDQALSIPPKHWTYPISNIVLLFWMAWARHFPPSLVILFAPILHKTRELMRYLADNTTAVRTPAHEAIQAFKAN